MRFDTFLVNFRKDYEVNGYAEMLIRVMVQNLNNYYHDENHGGLDAVLGIEGTEAAGSIRYAHIDAVYRNLLMSLTVDHSGYIPRRKPKAKIKIIMASTEHSGDGVADLNWVAQAADSHFMYSNCSGYMAVCRDEFTPAQAKEAWKAWVAETFPPGSPESDAHLQEDAEIEFKAWEPT